MAETNSKHLALITGASSGIGAAFAERLAHDGYNLILVARRRERLETLSKQLSDNYQIRAEVLVADLSKPDSIRAVEKRISDAPELDLLVNNAGFGGYMPFAELPPDSAEELINLQVLAVTRLTRAALPAMISRKQGAIINVSSRLAFSGAMGSSRMPKRATYAGTKAFINTFTQLLHSELEGTGIKVQALCPGVVATEFHGIGADPNRFPPNLVMQPEDVVTASLVGLKLGEVLCIPAMDDLTLLTNIQDSERKSFNGSATGSLAKRYIE